MAFFQKKIQNAMDIASAQDQLPQDYWSYVKRQYRKNKRAMFAMYFIGILAIIALFADFLANEKPLVCKYKGNTYFPIFREYSVGMGLAKWPADLTNIEWKKANYDWVVLPPIPYSPTNQDYANDRFKSPFDAQEVPSKRWWHWLGTDELGRDVMAGMIHGTRVAFMVGIVSMSVAFMIGLFFGAIAGYFGDSGLKMSFIRFWLSILGVFLGFFYGFFMRSFVIGEALANGIFSFLGSLLWGGIIFWGMILLCNLIAIPLKRIPFLGRQIQIPADLMITRFIEIFVSIPTFILILAMAAIAKPSIFNTMLIIGMTGWTGIARYVRAELLRVRQLEYIEAARALGFSSIRTMFKHAIPNALSPVFIALAFGIAGAVLAESSLSFLGVGVPSEMVTWGKLLSISRSASTAWWMAIFPGLAIFLTVTFFNLIGEGLTDAIDPRLKQ